MLEIDGSQFEGGGQILRTSLALSLRTQQAFRIQKIRAGRAKPGLQAQHLAGVRLAQSLGQALVEGAELSSTELVFRPQGRKAGYHKIDVGTAGSVTLLLQCCLWALPLFPDPVELDLRGGTDVNWAPPLDYLQHVTLPALADFVHLEIETKSRGYFPQGGGRILVRYQPKTPTLSPLNWTTIASRSTIHLLSCCSSDLEKRRIHQRLLDAFCQTWDSLPDHPNWTWGTRLSSSCPSRGSGAVLMAWASGGPVSIGVSALARKGVSSETLGQELALDLAHRIQHRCPIDEHLADQIIPLLALAGGQVAVQQVTPHTQANCAVTSQFLGRPLHIEGSTIWAPLTESEEEAWRRS